MHLVLKLLDVRKIVDYALSSLLLWRKLDFQHHNIFCFYLHPNKFIHDNAFLLVDYCFIQTSWQSWLADQDIVRHEYSYYFLSVKTLYAHQFVPKKTWLTISCFPSLLLGHIDNLNSDTKIHYDEIFLVICMNEWNRMKLDIVDISLKLIFFTNNNQHTK